MPAAGYRRLLASWGLLHGPERGVQVASGSATGLRRASATRRSGEAEGASSVVSEEPEGSTRPVDRIHFSTQPLLVGDVRLLMAFQDGVRQGGLLELMTRRLEGCTADDLDACPIADLPELYERLQQSLETAGRLWGGPHGPSTRINRSNGGAQ